MELYNLQENKIKCGKCGTEFDLNRNKDGCPLCGLGRKQYKNSKIKEKIEEKTVVLDNLLSIPPSLNLYSGKPFVNNETKTWGSWLMFNDFFAPKFLARVLAWKIKKENSEHIVLSSLIEDAVKLIKKYKLSRFKGFPNEIKKPNNLRKDNAVGRLIHHFLGTSIDMGFFKLEHDEGLGGPWEEIEITLTKEGLEFAQLRNPVFDDHKEEQILSPEEKNWLVDYLKEIDKQGYKEYSTLKEVYDFLKEGNDGKQDLRDWFEGNKKYQDYILERSKKARENNEVFKKQLYNYARTFASAKVSLLRELGVVTNKRNDYKIIGEL